MKATSSKSGNNFIFVDKNKDIDKEDKNNFEQVFNFKQLPSQTKNIEAQDNRVNQLIEQRNFQDKNASFNEIKEIILL